MTPRYRHTVKSWLDAERRDVSGEAEAAFDALFKALPRLAPSPGFSERVILATQPVSKPHAAVVPMWGWRLGLAGSLMLAGAMIWLFPLLRLLPVRAPQVSDLAMLFAHGWAWIGRLFSGGLEMWAFLSRLGHTVGVVVTTPEMATALMAAALVGATALYTLNHLLVFERRTLR